MPMFIASQFSRSYENWQTSKLRVGLNSFDFESQYFMATCLLITITIRQQMLHLATFTCYVLWNQFRYFDKNKLGFDILALENPWCALQFRNYLRQKIAVSQTESGVKFEPEHFLPLKLYVISDTKTLL